MSRFISLLQRHPGPRGRLGADLEAALRETVPEPERNLASWRADESGRHLQATWDVPDRSLRRGLALCIGKLYSPDADWWQPGSGSPDGSYVIVREDADAFEIVSDPAGSRMLWYYLDDEVFIASSSERALTMACGRFDFDRATVPWLVSTGTRGPGRSYNRHLRLVPPGGVARLDKAAWTLEVTAPEIAFAAVERSRDEHFAAIESALRATFASFGPEDARHMLIALSGGVDSRALAIFLGGDPAAGWRAYTGGWPTADDLPLSDASIARRVAGALGIAHRRIVTEAPTGSVEAAIRRFILGGEGRHDHLNGLSSGESFRSLREAPADTIVRGDECFGWKPVSSDTGVRQSMDLLLCGDIANFGSRLARFGLDGHRFPPELDRRSGETLAAWRDRLYSSFRVPTVLAALNESKSSYYDVVNPLLSRRVLEAARSLPDDLRTDKALFREVVDRLGPDVPFATAREGVPGRFDTLNHPEIRRLLRASLASPTAERAFGKPLTAWLRAETGPARVLADRVRRAITRRLNRPAAPAGRYHVPPLRLAFRLHVATTMIDQLTADAAHLARARAA